jgi:Na+/H+ antiporter NhaD/arsenite permease-like protein
MTLAVLAIFAIAYAGLALGRVPGLALDRAGMAVVAAILLVAIGAVPPGEVLGAMHFPTLVLLFALMVVSARFAAAGAYDMLAARIAAAAGSPIRLLVLVTGACGLLSAVLVNDVVVFAMAPLLVRGLRARGLDPRPFLDILDSYATEIDARMRMEYDAIERLQVLHEFFFREQGFAGNQ